MGGRGELHVSGRAWEVEAWERGAWEGGAKTLGVGGRGDGGAWEGRWSCVRGALAREMQLRSVGGACEGRGRGKGMACKVHLRGMPA